MNRVTPLCPQCDLRMERQESGRISCLKCRDRSSDEIASQMGLVPADCPRCELPPVFISRRWDCRVQSFYWCRNGDVPGRNMVGCGLTGGAIVADGPEPRKALELWNSSPKRDIVGVIYG